jgi:hypothetical protein
MEGQDEKMRVRSDREKEEGKDIIVIRMPVH